MDYDRKASQDLEEQWLALQEAEKDDDNIVSFDCAMHREFCQQLNIPSYPTIKIYHRDGRIDQYRGKHKAREYSLDPSPFMFISNSVHPPD